MIEGTIEELEKALKEDRAGFIKGLLAAGYVDTVVFNNSGNDGKLIELAAGMYTDLWDAFDIKAFESWVYTLA